MRLSYPRRKITRAIFGEKAGEVKDASKRAGQASRGLLLKRSFLRSRQREPKKKSGKILLYQKESMDKKLS